MGTISAYSSASEALDMVRTGLRFLANADATELTSEEQAEILRGLERTNSVAAAARTSVLGRSPQARTMRRMRITVRVRG